MIAIKDESLVPIGDSFNLLAHFFTGLAVDVPTLSTNFVLTHPPAILAAVDAPSPLPRLAATTTSVSCVEAVNRLNRSPTLMVYSSLHGRLAQRESAAFTRQRSLVRTQHRPLSRTAYLSSKPPNRQYSSESSGYFVHQ